MTVENIFELLTKDIDEISEIELIIKIQKFSKLTFQRACNGYRMMRESGIINDKIDKSTVGELETLESNVGIMLIITKFDCVPNNIQIKRCKAKCLKELSQYKPHELIPVYHTTRFDMAMNISKCPEYQY
jgi:hypothetical protein